jgi:hypothetical protein
MLHGGSVAGFRRNGQEIVLILGADIALLQEAKSG